MERLVILLIAFVLCLMNSATEEEVEVLLDRATKLNPDFYVDENAFMEVANALGFGINSVTAADSNEGNNNGGPRRSRYGRVAGMARSPR